jgi:hypothetical protein
MSNLECRNIPSLIKLSDFNGDYQTFEHEVYNIYKHDFIDNDIYFKGIKVHEKFMPSYKEMSGTFWHIVATENESGEKETDLRRYERIRYPRFLLVDCMNSCSKKLIWENKRGRNHRVLIYCEEIRYLVVLDKRKDKYIFWTAYPVNRKHTREKLLKEYKRYINDKTCSST